MILLYDKSYDRPFDIFNTLKYLNAYKIMTISNLLKNSGYSAVFGFMGLIVGIWTADLLYSLILHNVERTTTSNISLIIILVIIVASSVLGFTKGKELLEN